MKKWIFIISIFMIIITTISVAVYLNAVEPVRAAKEKAIMMAKEETDLTKVDEFNLYNGEESFYIVQGQDRKGTNIIIWVPEKEGKVVVKKESEGISREQAIKKVLEEIGSDEIISVKPGMENDIPLWEIHSRTKENLLNYHFLVFETGEWLKKIENL
ncbi:DUF5590 domain-containing protein [Bacillus sp. V3B]|uniref:cell wall elongation regulator TseB-like domain-containing protein n=1 Tax=Bacillus sp. V3B TaxID=2804915 RepID=UPI002109AD7D|nr:DUF5590 domain-containing protein [Bacillus sp. V3B]MCQ6273908.1 DUF5590 domain-containing protein [Bacillus sp. V3B]